MMSGLARVARACAALLMALVVCAAGASGAAVHMKDGRVFYGEILEQTRTTVVIRTEISNIPTELALRVREIERIDEDATAPEGEGEGGARGEGAPRRDDREARERGSRERSAREAARGVESLYLEIPIEGVFGEEVHAAGVERALTFAKRRGIEHIVFRINSPGGYLFAAEQVADRMRAFDAAFTYHAVVERAISASIFVTSHCDTVHLLPGASIGGAVAYSQDRTTGAAEVDAKMNSILASTLASQAEAKGQPGALVRAMVLMEAEVFAWSEEDGSVRVSDAWPEGAAGRVDRIDRDDTVLTLTSEEAERFGLASTLEGDVDSLGSALGLEGWRKFNDYGAAAMRRAQREADRQPDPAALVRRMNSLVDFINRAMEAATAKDPRNVSLSYYRGDGMLTPESKRAWVKATDEALAEWGKAEAGLREWVEASRRLERVGGEGFSLDMLNVRDLAERIADEKRRLREERNRQYIGGT